MRASPVNDCAGGTHGLRQLQRIGHMRSRPGKVDQENLARQPTAAWAAAFQRTTGPGVWFSSLAGQQVTPRRGGHSGEI
jgi:hypothetical protein